MNEEAGGTMLGRLQPGATVDQARATASAVSGRLLADRITTTPGRTLTVLPMRDQILGVAAPALRLLVVAAALVLLLALANLTNLMAARASAREPEFLVRLALGARPGSNARILLTETAVLALAGAVLGIGLAQLGVVSLARFASGQLPLGEQIRMDGPVLGVGPAAGAGGHRRLDTRPARHSTALDSGVARPDDGVRSHREAVTPPARAGDQSGRGGAAAAGRRRGGAEQVSPAS